MHLHDRNPAPQPASRPRLDAGEARPEAQAPPLRWQKSYERASVDRFLTEVEQERDRLREQITVAREQLRHAKAVAVESAEAQAKLAERFREVQREFDEAEDEHRTRVAAIAASASGAASRLMESASEHAAAIRFAASVVASEWPRRR